METEGFYAIAPKRVAFLTTRYPLKILKHSR